jgi:fimbrial isopeptide formation D2 family protein
VAAEYIASAISDDYAYDKSFDDGFDDGSNAGNAPSPSGTSFARGLAQALEAWGSPTLPYSTATAGTAFTTGTEGFWLFVANDANVGSNEAATAPIWFPLGGSSTAITEKNAIPTLDKKVREDRDGSWGTIADASEGQEVGCKLTATMPENIGSFPSYAMSFTDTLSPSVAPQGANTSSVAVTLYPTGLAGSAVTIPANSAHLSKGYADNKLTVEIDDVLSLGQAITKDSVVTVTYNIHLTDAAAPGATGNPSSARLTYSSDPVVPAARTTTTPKQTALAAYEIDLVKKDRQTGNPLRGAGFKVRLKAADGTADTASTGKWVGAHGELVAQAAAHEFKTDASGRITVPLSDAGTYVLSETSAPEGYETRPDIELDVRSSLDQANMLVSRLDVACTTTDVIANDDDMGTSASATTATGKIAVETADDKKVLMPITGMDGVTAGIVYGGGAIALGIAGLLVTRRRGDEAAGTATESPAAE